MKPSRRNPLRELEQLLRVPEEGSLGLAAFLCEHADELAPVLGSTVEDLRASADMPDEVIAPRVHVRLAHRREGDRERKALQDAEVSVRAATALGATVRWTEHGAVLDTDLLLGDVLADHTKRYVSFAGPDFTTAIEREALARTTPVVRMFIDVAAYVDAEGLHVRYRGGRGGFNWKPRFVGPHDRDRVLSVELQPAARRARPGAWLGELLLEMGYAI